MSSLLCLPLYPSTSFLFEAAWFPWKQQCHWKSWSLGMSPRAGESHSTKGLKPTQRVNAHYAFMTVLMVIGQEALGGRTLGAAEIGEEYTSFFVLVSVWLATCTGWDCKTTDRFSYVGWVLLLCSPSSYSSCFQLLSSRAQGWGVGC